MGGLLLGVQSSPGLPLNSLFSSMADGKALEQCQQNISYAVAYQPQNQSAYGKGMNRYY